MRAPLRAARKGERDERRPDQRRRLASLRANLYQLAPGEVVATDSVPVDIFSPLKAKIGLERDISVDLSPVEPVKAGFYMDAFSGEL